MENFTTSQLMAFLMASHRQSDFQAVEAILTAREADLKKQQSEELEELRSHWRALESRFTDEIAGMETNCDSLEGDLEASRKEALEKSVSFADMMETLRRKNTNDASMTRYLTLGVEDMKKECAKLEKERMTKSRMYDASLRNLQEDYEKHMADAITSLRDRCDFLGKELNASRHRCTSLERESKWYEEKIENNQRGKWIKRCEDLEARLAFLEEEEWNMVVSESSGKDQKGKSTAGVITVGSINGEGSTRQN